jgi:signal transduction histidine kinase
MAVSETSSSYNAKADEEADAQRVGELERRVRELEARARLAEAERDELARACSDARVARAAAEDAMRAREEILAVVTHDLRNPLGTIVMGATSLRQLGGSDDPRAQQRIDSIAERIQRQADRMARQISDLADLVELEAGRLAIECASHAPHAIIDTAGELVGPIARERGVAFEVCAEPDLPDVECDGERIVQALSNLVTSALKVTARGGAIEVGARPAENRSVVFFVRDRGPGANRDEAPSLYGPESRKAPPSERAGIGFALARSVVDAHGGQIWTVCEPSVGSAVCFSLTSPRN